MTNLFLHPIYCIITTQKDVVMSDQHIKQVIDAVFFHFEENIFVNNGVWPRRVNLVFAFLDYIETMKDEEIAFYLENNDKNSIDRFRFLVKQGTEVWLKQNMKTLVI